MPPTDRDLELKDALELIQPNEKEAPPKTLIPSGLDAVLWFNCEIRECLRRADGRYTCPQDDEDPIMYHIEDKLPSTKENALCERLEPLSEEHCSVASLVDRFVSFDQTTNNMRRWW